MRNIVFYYIFEKVLSGRLQPLLVLLAVLAWLPYFYRPSPYLKVTFFDVGQGDAILIETPQRQQILVDGGPDKKVVYELGRTLPFYDKTLDLVILTHPQADHLGGLIEVLKRYEVKALALVPVGYDSKIYENFKELVEAEETKIFYPATGDLFDLGQGVFLEVWWPECREVPCGRFGEDVNNFSLVLELDYQDFEVVLTGDAGEGVQEEILDLVNITEDIEVLKVPHHGAANALNKEFFGLIDPKLAVISVGKNNRYGHPRQEVLDFLNSLPLKVLRTDEVGSISVVSDGRSWRIE